MAGIRDAYLGEVAGAAIAEGFAGDGLSPADRDSCVLIARIETLTAQALEPLLDAPPSDGDIEQARQRGKAAVARLGGWPALIDYTAHGLDDYVDRFGRLRDAAPITDRPVLDLLVDHEIALRDFGRASLAGHDDPKRPLRDALAAAERHLLACR